MQEIHEIIWFITTCVLLTGNTSFYLLYGLIPVLVIGIDRYVKRDKPKAPVSLVGSMVDKTWQTFGIFTLSFCVFAILFDYLMVLVFSFVGLTLPGWMLKKQQ
jgi:hypothetical protein